MKYKMTLSYDGTNYHGWQRQHNGITIQEVLEDCLSNMFGSQTIVTGCSRTDAGVHAKTYVCNFDGETTIPQDKIPFVVNTVLPPDIRVYECEIVDDNFNAHDVITLAVLKEKGLISSKVGRMKVLADGMLNKPLTIKSESYSIQAIKMIELTGGTVIILKD